MEAHYLLWGTAELQYRSAPVNSSRVNPRKPRRRQYIWSVVTITCDGQLVQIAATAAVFNLPVPL